MNCAIGRVCTITAGLTFSVACPSQGVVPYGEAGPSFLAVKPRTGADPARQEVKK